MERASLKSSVNRHTFYGRAMTPNHAIEPTASGLRRLAVPSSLRSSAAAQRFARSNPAVVTFIANSPSLRLVTNAPPIWHIRCRPSWGVHFIR
jgi:hypothetical protein